MPLSDVAIRNAKPDKKTIRLFDGGGLYLEISPSGGKWWRFKYRLQNKEKRISLGVYPDVGLKDARRKRDEAKSLVIGGTDPSKDRRDKKDARVAKVADSFEIIAQEWLTTYADRWSKDHGERILHTLKKDIFPWIGHRSISEITPSELLSTLRRIESRGARETAHRVLQNCSQVFLYARSKDLTRNDPCKDLRGALSPVKKGHFSSITDPKAIGDLLRAIDSYEGYLVTKCALRLAPLVFVRPGELRNAEWKEINFDLAEWNIPSERMKMREPHLVPLSRQALEILQELHPLTGRGRYLFPSARSYARPMSNNAILAALRRMGYSKEEMTGHGFRAMARTVLDEVLGVREAYIEQQLAHSVRDPLGRAYNRTKHLPQRKEMMQRWADYLDELKAGAQVISFKSYSAGEA